MQIHQSLLLLAVLGSLTGAPASASPPVSTAGQWTIDTLTAPRKALASTSDGQRIYFAGGRLDTTRSDVVDIYDTATHSWSTMHMSEARSEFTATSVGNYVLFAGGATSPTTSTAKVDVLDTSTMTWSTASLSQARFTHAAAAVGSKAFFAGGRTGGPALPPSPADFLNTVDVYDSALGLPSDPLAWSVTTLSSARAKLASATVGTRVLFAGGGDNAATSDVVDIYDDATGTWSTAQLSLARVLDLTAGASAGGKAYFAGGGVFQGSSVAMSDRVDVYDSALGAPSNPLAWSWESLSIARTSLTAVALDDHVYFAGGLYQDVTGNLISVGTVDVMRASTGSWEPVEQLSSTRHNLAGAAAGHHVLFGGGNTTGLQIVATVDALVPTPYLAAEVSRAGTPPNPDALKPGLTSGPAIGATWDPSIDHTTFFPGALVDVLCVALAPGQVNLATSMGTLLCDLSVPPLYFVASPGVPFVCPIPADPSFVGLQLATQGASADGTTIALTNALDITIGAH